VALQKEKTMKGKIMKKTVLVLAVLMLAVPVMAGITITAAQVGTTNVVQVSYARTGGDDVNIPRAFALDVRMSPANATALVPTGFNSNFYVAPGTFTYNDVNGATYWGTRYVGPNTVGFTTEMGSLWATNDLGGHTAAPPSSGVLFSFTVDKTCDITLTQNAQRGGVVMESTAVTFPPEYVTFAPLPFLHVSLGPVQVAVPNVLGLNRVAARAAIVAVGLDPCEANSPPTVTYSALRTTSAQKPAAATMVDLGSRVDFNAVSYPIKTMTVANSLYVNWVARNRPACWAYPRQCRGDANGVKTSIYWVSTTDLTILKGALNKALTLIPAGGICADFNHVPTSIYWVSGTDLTILKTYLNKAESLVPLCGNVPPTGSTDPNYRYWCVPTGAVCPTGQLCAPVNVCPNSL